MKNRSHLLLIVIIVLSLAQGISTPFASTEKETHISGNLLNGYRVLSVSENDTSLKFVVYRGDYIKFDITDVTGDAELKIPSLFINQSLNPDLQNAQYFKMKEIGLYPFTLGSITGQIEVVEYDKPQYRTLTANEAANLIRDQSPLILDVRTPQEYSSGRIENSFLIPVQELQTRYAELSEYKNDDIFVYCATGNRSTVAAKILIDNGFTRIHNLRYGIYEWAKNGLPVIR